MLQRMLPAAAMFGELRELVMHAGLRAVELMLEAERTDAIVCDYNYVFDPQVYFRRYFQDEDYSDSILIAEAKVMVVRRRLWAEEKNKRQEE